MHTEHPVNVYITLQVEIAVTVPEAEVALMRRVNRYYQPGSDFSPATYGLTEDEIERAMVNRNRWNHEAKQALGSDNDVQLDPCSQDIRTFTEGDEEEIIWGEID